MTSTAYRSFVEKIFSYQFPSDLSLDEVRQRFENMLAQYPPPKETQFEPIGDPSFAGSWVLAPGCDRNKVVLFFFGGAYTAGSVQSHRGLMARISQASKMAVLGIEYHLAPEHPFPRALQDALTAYRWLLKQFSPEQIAFSGISAGGGLCLSLLLALQQEGLPPPKALALMCPWVDLTKREYANRKDILNPNRLIQSAFLYAAKEPCSRPLISPLFGNFPIHPPIFIQTSSQELLFEEILAFHAKNPKVQMDVWSEMIHCWHLFADAFPEAQEAIEKMGKFLCSSLQRC